MALVGQSEDQGNHIFKFIHKPDIKAVLFDVIISPSGLLSTKNKKGKPSPGVVHKATNYARKQVRR